MKKKLLTIVLSFTIVSTLLAGCGNSGISDSSNNKVDIKNQNNTNSSETDSNDDEAAPEGEEESETEAEAVTTVGPDSGTHMEMWSFVELHNTFYASMLEKWNEENPDRQIQITFTTYPFADMHNKLIMALQTGEGAPDLCDIEVGQFPNFLQGEVQLYPLNETIAPYKDDLVQARFDIYSKDGNYYGAPTHVGATVMYYNTEILDKYDIDYTKIVTWDDYTAAAERLKEASNGEVCMTSVDTAGVDWCWIAMSEYGEDWTGDIDGSPNIQLESVSKMLTMQQEWLNNGLAMISPDGHVDLEAGFQNIVDGNIASFPKAMWYMSRFLNYMPEMSGKFAIAPCPVFEKGQPRSVGIGGTGTVVTNQSSDPQLAADFIAYAKCSYDGAVGIWEQLGFDTCNTSLWEDETITQNKENQYIAFFKTNPFDVLNEIKEEIGKINVTVNSPTLNDYLCTTTLNEIFEDGMSVEEALQEAQDYIELEAQ